MHESGKYPAISGRCLGVDFDWSILALMDTRLLTKLPEWERIRSEHERWRDLMERKLTFSLKDSAWHTKGHCANVLLYALTIACRKGLGSKERDALGMASIFHDTRRQDDGRDVGHGARAAAYYREFCDSSSLAFDERAYLSMMYHDRDDEVGEEAIAKRGLENGVLVYRIFKDADALDRFRISPRAFDEKFLRTDEARALVGFAREFSTPR